MALMEPIPLLVVYKALGITDDKSMWETLGVGETDSEIRAFFVNLRRSLENEVAVSIKTQKEALIYIGKMQDNKLELPRVRVLAGYFYT